MSMNVGPGRDGAMVEMNVTPLIDVLLVLIITFMVVTNLTPKGLNARAPGPRGKVQNDQAMVLSVDASHHIQINGTSIGLAMLGAQLDEIFRTRNQRTLFVKADPTLTFGEVAHVIDIAKGAGIENVGLIGEKAPSE